MYRKIRAVFVVDLFFGCLNSLSHSTLQGSDKLKSIKLKKQKQKKLKR